MPGTNAVHLSISPTSKIVPRIEKFDILNGSCAQAKKRGGPGGPSRLCWRPKSHRPVCRGWAQYSPAHPFTPGKPDPGRIQSGWSHPAGGNISL